MPILVQNMGGIAPRITPELLQDNQAQVANNVLLHKGGVAPLKAPTTVATPSKSGTKKTIYRFGVSQPETQYWFTWTGVVNVCRGPIPGDTTERTYFTGDGAPKKTDFSLATTGGTGYPFAAYALGVPAPTNGPSVTAAIADTLSTDELVLGVLSDYHRYLGSSTSRFPFDVSFKVLRNGVDETNLWTVTADVVSLEAIHNSTNTQYTVTGTKGTTTTTQQVDEFGETVTTTSTTYDTTGHITFTAKRSGKADVTQAFHFDKNSYIDNAHCYRVISATEQVSRNVYGEFSPVRVSFSSTRDTGSGYSAYAGRFLISVRKNEVTTFTEAYISSSNESSTEFTIPTGTDEVQVVLLPATKETNDTVDKVDRAKPLSTFFVPVSHYKITTGEITDERAYVFTNVTSWGEESAPSPATMATRVPGTVLTLALPPIPSGSHNIAARRIYRTVSTAIGTNYYCVGEVTSAESTFTDDTKVTEIGEALPTLDWDVPPDTLSGLVALPSGAMCGFSGKDVCFSVVGAPYAWPQKYRKTCEYDVVAVAPMGQGVAVLTKGFPYFINTGDPEAASMVRLDEEQSCVSARSVVSYQGGVVYASPDGLVMLSQSGAKILTESLYDHDAWQALNPATIFAAKHDNRYYGFFEGGGGFVLDATGTMTTHDINATAAYVDPVLDQLYIAYGTTIQKWHSGSAKTTTWKSKRFNLPTPTNFSCYQVKANSFNDLTLKVYVDGALKHTASVGGANVHRLPAGFRSQVWEFEISGTDHWTMLAVGASIQEMKNV